MHTGDKHLDQNFLKDYQFIIGCDEVGRGPIAGPVVGCAVKVPCDLKLIKSLKQMGFTDSKKLSSKKRQSLISEIHSDLFGLSTEVVCEGAHGIKFVLWELGPAKIDEINILNASLYCMYHAAKKLYCNDSFVLIDGNQDFRTGGQLPTQTIIKGDSKSVAIAVASVLAKEFRDEKMRRLDVQYPGYGLASHAGYPTKLHKQAVADLGVTPIHRKSFKGVKEHVLSGATT